MKRRSVLSAALFAAAILPATGCVDWSIAAPEHALVLARDDGNLPARLMTSRATPLIRQRQIGFVSFPPWSGTALWRADEIFSSARFSTRVKQPLPDVYRAALPFLAIRAVAVLLVTYVPWLTQILPALLLE